MKVLDETALPVVFLAQSQKKNPAILQEKCN